jgi:formylglycine-generating enzyme required for sulfatase activity
MNIFLQFALLAMLGPVAYASDGENAEGTFKHFKDCDICSEMIVVPGGKFQMGTTEEDSKIIKEADSSPMGSFVGAFTTSQEPSSHLVEVKPFALAKYDVTRAQFAVFVRETHFEGKGCSTLHPNGIDRSNEADWRNPWFEQTDQDPVVCVSWNDAQQFIAWINSKLPPNKAKYRLPTEVEWEYAARAGTTTPTYWGDPSKQCKFANVGDVSTIGINWAGYNAHVPRASCNDGYSMTSPVGAFPPNPWGFYDMLGNVLQWMQDCYVFPGYPAIPTSSSNCGRRSERGSSWSSSRSTVRVAARNSIDPNNRNRGTGFRLAADLPDQF